MAFVGDGDFSLSKAFAEMNPKSCVVVATSLSRGDIDAHWKGKDNVTRLENMANVERVAHDIDATKTEDMMIALSAGGRADAIVFAFPHLPGKGKISKNRALLRNFLPRREGRESDDTERRVRIALAPGQGGTFMDGNESRTMYGDTWKAYDMGADVGMALVECERVRRGDMERTVV